MFIFLMALYPELGVCSCPIIDSQPVVREQHSTVGLVHRVT